MRQVTKCTLSYDRLRSKLVCVLSLARQLNVQSKGAKCTVKRFYSKYAYSKKTTAKKESERPGGDEINWSSGRKLQPTSWDTLYAQNVNLYHNGYINVYNVCVYISRKGQKWYPFRSVTGRIISLLAIITTRPIHGVYSVCLPPSRIKVQ